jgi:hypothetical protein
MNRIFFIAALAGFAFYGCSKGKICGCAPPYQIYYLRAKVVQTSDLSCGRPILDFTEDSTHVRYISGINDLTYAVTTLPATMNVVDKKLYVFVTLLKPEEDFICHGLGVSFPHLKLTDAKPRD